VCICVCEHADVSECLQVCMCVCVCVHACMGSTVCQFLFFAAAKCFYGERLKWCTCSWLLGEMNKLNGSMCILLVFIACV
jgi:hypothetical protein